MTVVLTAAKTVCVANPAVPPGSAHSAIFNAPAHTALSGAWWELKLKKHCCFVKAPPDCPLSSVCSEAIWCWVCPVLSLDSKCHRVLQGKQSSQAAHSQFSRCCAEAGSGCLPWLPAHPLPAQLSEGLSHTGKTETASASEPHLG